MNHQSHDHQRQQKHYMASLRGLGGPAAPPRSWDPHGNSTPQQRRQRSILGRRSRSRPLRKQKRPETAGVMPCMSSSRPENTAKTQRDSAKRHGKAAFRKVLSALQIDIAVSVGGGHVRGHWPIARHRRGRWLDALTPAYWLRKAMQNHPFRPKIL